MQLYILFYLTFHRTFQIKASPFLQILLSLLSLEIFFVIMFDFYLSFHPIKSYQLNCMQLLEQDIKEKHDAVILMLYK